MKITDIADIAKKITKNMTGEGRHKIAIWGGAGVAVIALAVFVCTGGLAGDSSAKEAADAAQEAWVEAGVPDTDATGGDPAGEPAAAGEAAGGDDGTALTGDEAAAAGDVSGGDVAAGESAEGAETETKGEYANLAIADVSNYVNVRSEPNTDSEIVGKMYDGSVAEIRSKAGENDEWLQVVSGKVEGYIKAEYFIYGDDAAAVIDNYVKRYVVVKATRLNVRKEPDLSAKRIGYLDNGARAVLVEWGDEWSKIEYAGEKEAYVASEYVTVAEEFIYAKSIEEERAEQAAIKEQQARAKASEKAVPEQTMIVVPPPPTNYENVSELRMAIVNYAKQFLGNRYIMGGQSLAGGTDCSGFTCYIYRDFGYSLSRTPQGQLNSAGRPVDISEIQPGDIICYSSNGSTCTHVGMYIGDGQIIHSANRRAGVVIGKYNYGDKILGVRNVVD